MPVIRSATPRDLPILDEIERRSFALQHWEAHNFLIYSCVVAELDCRVAGFLISREVFPQYREAPAEREILNLAVDPLYRRLGIATALLQHELNHKATHFLEVRETNTAARKLYQKLGFVEIGRRPHYYSFPTETAIVMHFK